MFTKTVDILKNAEKKLITLISDFQNNLLQLKGSVYTNNMHYQYVYTINFAYAKYI